MGRPGSWSGRALSRHPGDNKVLAHCIISWVLSITGSGVETVMPSPLSIAVRAVLVGLAS